MDVGKTAQPARRYRTPLPEVGLPGAAGCRRSACAPAVQLKQPGERTQVAQQLVSAGGGP
jgi:hypothetical protein